MARPTLDATIVIPAHNSAGTIRTTLDSAAASIAFHRAHGGGPVEIIVVDDASGDETAALVRNWAAAHENAVLHQLRRNAGAAAARNAGAGKAQGPILFFLDADDDFLPPHLFACLGALERVPEAGYVRPEIKYDAEIHSTWKTPLQMVIPSSLAVRRVCHDFVGGFPDDPSFRATGGEDMAYMSLMMRYFSGVLLDLETVHHRSYPGNYFARQLEKFRQPLGAVAEPNDPEKERVIAKRIAILDKKADKKRRSFRPQLYGMRKAPIVQARGVADWIAQAHIAD